MTQLQVRDLCPEFGAEIVGMESPDRLDEDARRLLQQVFDDRSLLVFRGLDLDRADQTVPRRAADQTEPVCGR